MNLFKLKLARSSCSRRAAGAVILMSGLLFGCAPGLKTALPVAEIPGPGEYHAGHAPTPFMLGLLADGRESETIGRIDGREVTAAGDVTGAVRGSLLEYLKASGVESAPGDGPMLRGTVLSWLVEVTPGFPASSAEGTAAVELELVDSAHRVLYTGRYEGQAARKDPFLTEEKIRTVLGEAMAFALREASRDERLLAEIRSPRSSGQ